MRHRSLDQTMTAFLYSLNHHHRCLDQARSDACVSLLAVWTPMLIPQEYLLEQRFDRVVLDSVTLLQVHADGQRDLQRVAEEWLSAFTASWLDLWRAADCPFSRALLIGDLSCGSLSRVSRQVGHFAATRWNAAAMHATQDARRAWRRESC